MQLLMERILVLLQIQFLIVSVNLASTWRKNLIIHLRLPHIQNTLNMLNKIKYIV